VRAALRASGPANGPRGGGGECAGAGEGGGGRDIGQNWPSRGKKSFFFFLFIFNNSFLFLFLFFLNK
jgi:hypothetical protein